MKSYTKRSLFLALNKTQTYQHKRNVSRRRSCFYFLNHSSPPIGPSPLFSCLPPPSSHLAGVTTRTDTGSQASAARRTDQRRLAGGLGDGGLRRSRAVTGVCQQSQSETARAPLTASSGSLPVQENFPKTPRPPCYPLSQEPVVVPYFFPLLVQTSA